MSLVDSKNIVLSSRLVCALAKQTRLPFQRSVSRANTPFDLIHGDVWGPHRLPTHDGKRFFLTLVVDCSRMTWLFLLHLKREVSTVIHDFLLLIKSKFNASVKVLEVTMSLNSLMHIVEIFLKLLV